MANGLRESPPAGEAGNTALWLSASSDTVDAPTAPHHYTRRRHAMGDPLHPLQPGEPAPGFTLPAANREGGMVSLADLHGRPFVLGLFRGLHCPFCRRQVRQL